MKFDLNKALEVLAKRRVKVSGRLANNTWMPVVDVSEVPRDERKSRVKIPEMEMPDKEFDKKWDEVVKTKSPPKPKAQTRVQKRAQKKKLKDEIRESSFVNCLE